MAKEKYLVLSCGTGEGHNSAAKALLEEIRDEGCDGVLLDPVSLAGQPAARAVSGAYNGVIKYVPKLFGVIYGIGKVCSDSPLPSPIYAGNTLYAEALHEYLAENRFDAVFATHLFGMEAMTAVRRRYLDPTPFYGILTDYTCIPFLQDVSADLIFTPHPDLTEEIVAHGIPAKRILATGIPASKRFSATPPKKEARRMLGLPEGERVYLLMSGGVGCSYVTELCCALLSQEEGDFSVLVLTGRNLALRRDLMRRFSGDPHVKTVPFTDRVDLYMAAADAVLTKPGGLTGTEAILAGIPLVEILAVPGCETANAAFFLRHGMSRFGKDPAHAAALARHLVSSPAAAEKMIRCQRKNAMPDAAARILEAVRSHE